MTQFSFSPFRGGEAVTEYATRYRRSDVPPLEAGTPLDLFPSEPAPADFIQQLTWEHPWPFGDRAGVYLIYSEAFELLYVGKAQHLGSRLYTYFRAGDACVVQHEFWPQRPRFVINIAVPADMPFEAPALEAYLIRALQPVCNVSGK